MASQPSEPRTPAPDSAPSPHAVQPSVRYDVIVIGAGASGLMCAIEAGKRGRRVLVLEHAAQVGKKVLISGGGRCNFTNVNATPDKYISENPRFCVSALSRYTSQDFIALVEKHRIPYHEKKLGQLFCDGSAKDIVRLLLTECDDAGVTIRVDCKVAGVQRDDGFALETTVGPVRAGSLVMASGGLSIPKMGATGFSYAVARQFGLEVVPTRPGLVPFTFSGPLLEMSRRLAGVSIPCVARCGDAAWEENLLFTHRGVSGPAILQVSSFWQPGQEVRIDLLPGLDLSAHLKEQQAVRPRTELATVLSGLLPRNFVLAMCENTLPNKPIAQLSRKDMDLVVGTLKDWTITPDGTEGYRTAEVTVGGVDTRGLSSKTMEAARVPGLFFIGEGVDVTGPLGGYNFQWAWASGWCAGQYA